MLPYFAIIALLVCTSCTAQPAPGAGNPPTSPSPSTARPLTKIDAPRSQVRKSPGGRPDPRYRQPLNFAELQAVAGEVAKATGRKIHWRLALGEDPGPLVRIRGGRDDCTLTVHPVAARKVPPNTWAFLFGHEFAHLTENLGPPSKTNSAKRSPGGMPPDQLPDRFFKKIA